MHIPQQLETDRLILRRLIKKDIQPFYAFLSDKDATRYMAFAPEQKTLEGATAMVDMTLNGYDTENAIYVLAITLKENGTYIGSLGATPDTDTNGIEFFYTLLPDYHGQGYATEAAQRLVQSLLEDNNADHLVAYIMTGNDASIRVAERLGMTLDKTVIRDGNEGLRYHLIR